MTPFDPINTPMPGDILRAEITKKGWTQAELARIVQKPLPTINEIIQGKKSISPEMAVALGAAFGQPAEYWARLDADYRLALVPHDTTEIQRRLRLHEAAPIKDMEKRGWIKPTSTTDALESELCDFFGVSTLNDAPKLSVMPRKADRLSPLSAEQMAWAFRARQVAAALPVAKFDPARMPTLSRKVRELAAYPEEARHVPRVLAEHGIRFVVVEPLPSGAIDGAAFWLREDQPVVALSIRLDRIDAFWFTLCHELSHIRHHDAESVDTDIYSPAAEQVPSLTKDDMEQRADAEAADMLISRSMLESFVTRVGPLYSKERIVRFANRVRIHPGIIVGQLQYRGEIKYSANREMLAKVRDRVVETAVTDGWGKLVGTI